MMIWLIAATLKGSLVIALAMLLRGRIASRWMHALLLIAVVRLLMPVAPESSFSVFNLAPRTELAEREPVLRNAPVPARPTVEARVVPFREPAPRFDRTSIALASIWAIGCAFVLLRAFARMRVLRRRLRDRVEVRLPLVDECRVAVGVRRRVRAFETDAVSTPALLGLVRPMLLLPRGFTETFSHDQLRFIVLHELAHLKRADVLVNWLTTFAQALHWFNPLVHLAAARLAEERELACDALALERLRSDERSAYGGTVLAVLDRMRQPSPAPGLVGMTTTHRQLKRRIMMIAAYRPRRRSSLFFAAALAVVALASLTDAVAETPRSFDHRIVEPLSPVAESVMHQLDARMVAEMDGVTIADVIADVSRRTGVSINIAEGALNDEERATTFTLNANNVPALMVLSETADAIDLRVRFSDTGSVVLEQLPEGSRLRDRLFGGRTPEELRAGLVDRAPVAAGPGDHDVVEFRNLRAEGEGSIDPALPRTRTFVDIRGDVGSAEDGAIRRSMAIRGSREGQAEGSLRMQVHRGTTSSSR